MRWLLLLLLLASCGGGGGSTPSAAPSPVSNIPSFGFWGDAGMDAWHADVGIVFCQDESVYGDPEGREWRKGQQIQCLQRAQGYGIKRSMVGLGYLLFDAHFAYQGPHLAAPFCRSLATLGITPTAWYVLDEPDVHGVSDATMRQVAADVRSACPGPKLATVYGDSGHGTPGAEVMDWIGRDDYGGNELAKQPPLLPGQGWIILAPGSDPWRADPAPYLAFAQHNPVEALFGFEYACCYSGTQYAGIGTNGMVPAYEAIGTQILAH